MSQLPARFELTEKDLGPGRREIRVAGELDLAVTDQLATTLETASTDCSKVLIDLEECEFIDSTGIAVILTACRRFEEARRQVVVCGATGQVERILSVTGLTQNGLVFEQKADALATP